MSRNRARQERLENDYDELLKLEQRSEFIRIQPIDVVPGWPPEKYHITFTCRGIARIDGNQRPIASDRHVVLLKLPAEYPCREPELEWLTDIWHPNIDHAPPRHVCVDAPETYYIAKSLAEQVVVLGEMVQYQRYHARHEPPWPQDHVVAEWCRTVAEPKNWIGPDKPFDPRPLLREHRIRRVVAIPGRIQLGMAVAGPEPAKSGKRIRLGTQG